MPGGVLSWATLPQQALQDKVNLSECFIAVVSDVYLFSSKRCQAGSQPTGRLVKDQKRCHARSQPTGSWGFNGYSHSWMMYSNYGSGRNTFMSQMNGRFLYSNWHMFPLTPLLDRAFPHICVNFTLSHLTPFLDRAFPLHFVWTLPWTLRGGEEESGGGDSEYGYLYVNVWLIYCVSESTLLCHANKCLQDYTTSLEYKYDSCYEGWWAVNTYNFIKKRFERYINLYAMWYFRLFLHAQY